jgi:hypothetical protein
MIRLCLLVFCVATASVVPCIYFVQIEGEKARFPLGVVAAELDAAGQSYLRPDEFESYRQTHAWREKIAAFAGLSLFLIACGSLLACGGIALARLFGLSGRFSSYFGPAQPPPPPCDVDAIPLAFRASRNV